MKVRQVSGGATLVLVVLFTLVFLMLILLATLRLGLTSRQNSTDQRSILQAQYAAESRITLARSHLRDLQTILSSARTGGVPNLLLPAGTTPQELDMLARKFCAQPDGSLPDWQNTDDFPAYRLAQECRPTPINLQDAGGQLNNIGPTNMALLERIVQAPAYQLLPASERPAPGADLAAWWLGALKKVDGADLRYTISPIRAVKLSAYRYRFYLALTDLSAAGGQRPARRFLEANRTSSGEWWFELGIPGPFDYVGFINRWPEGAGGWSREIFDGNVIVNEKARFADGANVTFYGDLNSAGCVFSLGSEGDCTGRATPGYFTALTLAQTGTPLELAGRLKASGVATFAEGKTPRFDAPYQPFPASVARQAAAAQQRGLVADSARETVVELFAGDQLANPLSQYDTARRAWQEPSSTFQYVIFKEDSGTVTRAYRADASGRVYQKDLPSGQWGSVPVAREFNGILYSAGNLTVRGPVRLSGGAAEVSQMPPALASFSQMNVVAGGGLNLTGDLTLSRTPCENQQVVNKSCTSDTRDGLPTNMLGLLAAGGDVTLAAGTLPGLTLHASVTAAQGGLEVQDVENRPDLGQLKVIGNVVVDRAGAPGQRSGGSLHGYQASYSYDNRFRYGLLPPGAASLDWQATDASGTGVALDNVSWRQVSADDFQATDLQERR